MKNDAGEMSMSEESKRKAWLEHYYLAPVNTKKIPWIHEKLSEYQGSS